ncbi:MAG: hypothetical protein WC455_29980 [Dehalococcoidia bacterium]|jgi:hypothetical protein
MPTKPKPITQHIPNPTSGRSGPAPIGIKIPTVAEAEGALAKHRAKEPPKVTPLSPERECRVRREWLLGVRDEKGHLVQKGLEQYQLELHMAKNAEANTWDAIFRADPGPGPDSPRGWPHRKREGE